MGIKEIVKKCYDYCEGPSKAQGDVYVGHGLNLTKAGIDEDIAEELLSREIAKIWRHLAARYGWWEGLDHDTQTKLMLIVYDSPSYDLDDELVEAVEKGDYELVDAIFNQILEEGEHGFSDK